MNPISNLWTDTASGSGMGKVYVVQTSGKVIERCILMATDPGDLVLDPTCGSGTTAYVAEQWGRRWITIDTSRVALALARARIMGARYPYYLLADSKDGQQKEAEVTRTIPAEAPTTGDVRQGFVYKRVPHIMLKDIANNAEIDVIWETLPGDPRTAARTAQRSPGRVLGGVGDPARGGRRLEGRQPRSSTRSGGSSASLASRQIDASIAAKADDEYLYDKPYEDKRKVRVAGPFTVESVSPHRMLGVDEEDELIDNVAKARLGYGESQDFASMILENLRTAGVQQAHKEDKIVFSSLTPWPGEMVGAEGRYVEGGDPENDYEGGTEKRAAILIGPEFGTVSRPDLVQAAREAAEADFDVLISCAFNYEALASEFNKLGRVPVLKARMNADLHMAGRAQEHRHGQPLRHLRRAGPRHPERRRGPDPGQGQRR